VPGSVQDLDLELGQAIGALYGRVDHRLPLPLVAKPGLDEGSGGPSVEPLQGPRHAVVDQGLKQGDAVLVGELAALELDYTVKHVSHLQHLLKVVHAQAFHAVPELHGRGLL